MRRKSHGSVHFFEQMVHAERGFLAATSENMVLHVDMDARKTVPFPADLLADIEAMAEAHRGLPRPPQAGHVIGIPRAT